MTPLGVILARVMCKNIMPLSLQYIKTTFCNVKDFIID